MRLRHILSVVLPLAALAGCSDATAPSVPPTAQAPASTAVSGVAPAEQPGRIAEYRGSPVVQPGWAKAWIGPEGGVLRFQGFQVTVPAGAVSRTMQFSIRIPLAQNDSATKVVAEFEPRNVAFARPVTIELPYAGTSAEGATAKILRWDGAAEAWVDVGGQLSADGQRAATEVPQLSTHATADDRGGTVVTSGG